MISGHPCRLVKPLILSSKCKSKNSANRKNSYLGVFLALQTLYKIPSKALYIP
ncbi:hypothetical protein NEOC65_001998 [Neochlamydia sp. AcF65]|nr:hypothetical protein [Neochlamydia sp. AcF65]NGY94608.1 hypothetical protein [Neochlamydia sp. AcF84]